jgi:hypothetical protein
MSEVKVNKISPRTNCGTVQLGDSGDTITIPAGATITNNGTQTGFGRTGTVDWDTTAKTASFTAVSGNGYFVNTTSGAITLTLPASPSAGDIVSFKDYAYTFATNNLTIAPNGSPIGGSGSASIVYDVNGTSKTFIYVDGTQGWLVTNESTDTSSGENFMTATGGTITTCGNCKIHTFTSPGTFTVCSVSTTPNNNIVSYLVVAGGGGSGSDVSGGAGAGGFREVKSPTTPYTASPLDGYPSAPNRITVTATSFPITVGGGGAGATPGGASSGSNSVFSTITSAGGGAAGTPSPNNGTPGGSGGGGYRGCNPGGTGNTPPVSPPQGNNGGNGWGASAGGAGGGGGALENGAGGTADNVPGNGGGGNGAATLINPATGESSGCTQYYSGGGGGGSRSDSHNSAPGGPGGLGGGGDGAGGVPCGTAGSNGTANTGGGGGGSTNGPAAGGTGGSGIVIIRYKYQ